MKREDLLLKIIAAAGGERLTPVQLQKVAFLVGKQFANDLPDYYEFEKYHYGPFCVDLYRDAEALQRDGLISITLNPRGGWKEFAATPKGIEVGVEENPGRVASFIAERVTWAMDMSFQELVRAVYRSHPQYRENSVFQG